MGIGDWAQSPIPNPQSPIPNPQSPIFVIIENKNIYKNKLVLWQNLEKIIEHYKYMNGVLII
jgi:hypothetical protein